MHLKPGTLVVYKQKRAVISAVSGDKLEINIDGGGAKSVRPKDVEPLHPGPAGNSAPAIKECGDFREISELMEAETLPFAEFCDLAYGSFDPVSAWSAWLLLQEGTYFTGSPEKGVAARSAAEIAAAENAIKAKEEAVAAREALLQRIKNGKIIDADRPALREIEQLALGRIESSKLMRDLDIAPEMVNAHKLLLALGVWDCSVDPWPERYGVDLHNPDIKLPPLPDEAREDMTHLAAYAIDDADSHDPDDAISFHDNLLYVHVADVAALVAPDSEADLEAAQRGANLYIPETISHMLPVSATEILGLGLHDTTPALTFVIELTSDGETVLQRMTKSTIRATRLTYETAAEPLDTPDMRRMCELLQAFRDRRAANGALFIDLPEVKIKAAADGKVDITPIYLVPAREIVANAMLAAGSAVGKWAEANEIAMPFAVQSEPEGIEHATSMAGMFAMRRGCTPSSVTTAAGKHAGLGLEPYVRVTSPLRRYSDLLAHQQLRRALDNLPPMSSDELEARLAASERGGSERRKLERQCNEYWKLVYLQSRKPWFGEAVMVFQQDDRMTFMIPELAYDYKSRFGGKVLLDERVKIELKSADPVNMSAKFAIVEHLN